MRAVVKRVRALLIVPAFLLCSGPAFAQSPVPRSTPPPPPVDPGKSPGKDDSPLTTFEEEIRMKRAIKMAEKDHQENVNRAREMAQLGKELQEGLKDQSNLDRDALKKVERLEKLTKKIRGEAGGEDEEIQIVNRPADVCSAVKRIAETTESLSKDVQNTPRQVVSASVISNANVLLELIKILRTFVRQP
jgi:hypothetical protein